MADELSPCPFCGSTNLKHYVTQASGGTMRGVVVCETCGCRLEHYTDHVHFIAEAYGGDWKSANEYAREDARIKVAQRWNRRAERTCHMEYAGEVPQQIQYSCYFCSECGSPIYNDMEPSYCLYCGARVVDES